MVKIREWTDEEVELLRDLYTSTRTFDEIVEKFPKRTENAIRLKASRLGIKRPILGNVVHLKCKECGSWIQVDDETSQRSTVLSCGKCGNIYQILADL